MTLLTHCKEVWSLPAAPAPPFAPSRASASVPAWAPPRAPARTAPRAPPLARTSARPPASELVFGMLIVLDLLLFRTFVEVMPLPSLHFVSVNVESAAVSFFTFESFFFCALLDFFWDRPLDDGNISGAVSSQAVAVVAAASSTTPTLSSLQQ